MKTLPNSLKFEFSYGDPENQKMVELQVPKLKMLNKTFFPCPSSYSS